VLVSAPADGADADRRLRRQPRQADQGHLVVSNASCTTNCLAPVAKVLNDAVGIEHRLHDHDPCLYRRPADARHLHKDLYRGRAAAMSMIPTSTGAAKAIGLVLPELKGKLDGVSIRVPTPNVSVIDFKIRRQARDQQGRNQRRDEARLRAAAQGHPRLYHRAQRLDRLQPRPAFVDLPRGMDQTKVHERHAGARADVLVRQ
jgi:glyceraldehyde 3-phosphate dehydrogenase